MVLQLDRGCGNKRSERCGGRGTGHFERARLSSHQSPCIIEEAISSALGSSDALKVMLSHNAPTHLIGGLIGGIIYEAHRGTSLGGEVLCPSAWSNLRSPTLEALRKLPGVMPFPDRLPDIQAIHRGFKVARLNAYIDAKLEREFGDLISMKLVEHGHPTIYVGKDKVQTAKICAARFSIINDEIPNYAMMLACDTSNRLVLEELISGGVKLKASTVSHLDDIVPPGMRVNGKKVDDRFLKTRPDDSFPVVLKPYIDALGVDEKRRFMINCLANPREEVLRIKDYHDGIVRGGRYRVAMWGQGTRENPHIAFVESIRPGKYFKDPAYVDLSEATMVRDLNRQGFARVCAITVGTNQIGEFNQQTFYDKPNEASKILGFYDAVKGGPANIPENASTGICLFAPHTWKIFTTEAQANELLNLGLYENVWR